MADFLHFPLQIGAKQAKIGAKQAEILVFPCISLLKLSEVEVRNRL